jgi:protein-disulfide isomerase
MKNTMMKNNVERQDSNRATTSGLDLLGLGTLVGVIVMLTIAFVNVWNLGRLGSRVAAIEARLGGNRTPAPDPAKVYEVQTSGAQAKGAATAPVTIVEFSDFQCPFCARVVPTLKQIEESYQGSVRIVWKHLPLPIHKDAVGAALAAEAAGKQGKFWEFHDRLFADQTKLGSDDLRQHARDLQLDMSRFETDILSDDEKKKVDADIAEANALGVSGTPGIFINGRFIAGAVPYEEFAKVIDEELTRLDMPVPVRP